MITKLLCIISTLFLSLYVIDGKKFGRCELAKILVAHGIARDKISDWICLAEHESSLNSAAKSRPNKNGSVDFGIFQINNKYWCTPPSQYNECNIECSKFLDDNLDDDIKCAKKIYNRHKFDAWYAWKNNCKGKDLKVYVKDCKY
ncbi:lysozyme c-1-like [Centruroides sculpturatus]|uniref:lysozyme c-1-like n=1 Tax=Centruroides sculpturatus TaxID=218467 RepID=UPI000C6D88E8|nr:lysozyme c-1-like [Centruroides sculpturatus]